MASLPLGGRDDGAESVTSPLLRAAGLCNPPPPPAFPAFSQKRNCFVVSVCVYSLIDFQASSVFIISLTIGSEWCNMHSGSSWLF
uniref:Uncharacterized protein n=1 Tax=Arundo donax TaxID=35708 RepID=A0A0A9EAH4_ARUDO